MPAFKSYASALHGKENKSEDDERMSSHLDFFLNYMQTEHATMLRTITGHTDRHEIIFDLLWAILVPRTIIYSACPVTGVSRAVRLKHAKRMTIDRERCWAIEGEYVEYNEKCHAEKATRKQPKFGISRLTHLFIMEFDGVAKITSLPHYPIRYHSQVEQRKEELVERGRKWATLQGAHLMHFKGTGMKNRSEKVFVCPSSSCRIVTHAEPCNSL